MVADLESVPILDTTDRRTPVSSTPDGPGKAASEGSNDSEKGGRTEENAEESGEAGRGKVAVPRWVSYRGKGTFVLLGLTNTASCMCFSLLAPFFPEEAHAKGISPAMTGLVFSCYEFVVFTTCLFFGGIITRLGSRKTFLVGQFIAGTCTALFGLSYLNPPGAAFLAQCIVLRVVQALGVSAFSVALITLVAQEFPAYVTTVYGALKVFNGLGFMIGPVLGGALFELGGFGLPFYVVGGLLLGCFASTFFLLPESVDKKGDDTKTSAKSSSFVDKSFGRLVFCPLTLLALFTVIVGAYSITFYESSVAIHLDQFHMTTIQKSSMFMIVASLYAVFSPLFGWLSDRKRITYPFLILGNFGLCLSLLLIGPSPLLPFLSLSLELTVVSLLLFGLGLAGTVVPVLKSFYVAARELGFEEGLRLDGFLSGLLNSSFHFGAFIGPLVGNILIEIYGYRWSTTLNAGFCLVNGLCIVVYVISKKTFGKKESNDTGDADVIVPSSKLDCKNEKNYSAIPRCGSAGTESKHLQ